MPQNNTNTNTNANGSLNTNSNSGGNPFRVGMVTAISKDTNGDLIGVDISEDTVFRIDQDSGSATLISGASVGDGPEIDAPNALYSAPDGSILVATFARRVYRVDPDTGDRTLILDDADPMDQFPDSFSAVFATTGGDVYVGAFSAEPYLARIDEGTGTLVEVESPNLIRGIESVAVESATSILVIDSIRRAVVRVDLMTGADTVVSNINTAAGPVDTEVGTGSDFGQPREVVIAGDGTIYVADEANSSFGLGESVIFRVDPATGDRTVASGPDVGSGPEIGRPVRMVADDDGLLVLVDANHDDLLVIDPATGDRTFLGLK